jgi:[ribosomal protein S18]-alanine N-acetyltransferase
MQPLPIVPMTKNHIAPVLAIERSSFPNPWGELAFLNEIACDHSRNYILSGSLLPEPTGIVAYSCLRVILDEIHLLKVAVAPACRRLGIAYRFLRDCLNLTARQGIRSAFLEVRPSNTAGLCLYRKLGFEIVGNRPGYYSDSGEAAIIMKKTF